VSQISFAKRALKVSLDRQPTSKGGGKEGRRREYEVTGEWEGLIESGGGVVVASINSHAWPYYWGRGDYRRPLV